MELRGLNDKQLQAVKATEGRVRIIAGAGSGKTRVLATGTPILSMCLESILAISSA